jgi:hypothetical protein
MSWCLVGSEMCIRDSFRPSLLHSGGGDIKKVRKYGLVHFGFMRSDERSSQQPINVV